MIQLLPFKSNHPTFSSPFLDFAVKKAGQSLNAPACIPLSSDAVQDLSEQFNSHTSNLLPPL